VLQLIHVFAEALTTGLVIQIMFVSVLAKKWIACITSPVVSVSTMTWIIFITSPVDSVSAKTWIICITSLVVSIFRQRHGLFASNTE
jgi:hypothetical protein